jgi:hypothetical protein
MLTWDHLCDQWHRTISSFPQLLGRSQDQNLPNENKNRFELNNIQHEEST